MVEPTSLSPEEIKDKAIGAAGWSSISKIAQYVISVSLFAILANILPPSDYGLLSTVLIFTHFFAIAGNFGLGAALIQRKDVTNEHYSSVLIFNLVSALVYFGVIALASGYIASYFENPLISKLLLVSALMFFPQALNVVFYAKLEKELDFKPIFIANTLGWLVSGGVSIYLAFSGYGVWSLVYRSVLYAIVVVIVQWMIMRWFPGFRFSVDRIRELWSFGINLTGFRFAKYWSSKADGLLILKFIGESALGLYSKAAGIVVEPVKMLSAAIGEIMFPAMSAVNTQKEEMKKLYLDGFSSLLVVSLPFCLTGYFVSKSFVHLLLGEEWIDIIPVFEAMFAVGLAQSLMLSSDWIFMSIGKTNAMLRWSLVSALAILGTISFGLWMGFDLTRLAWIYALVSFLLLPVLLGVSGSLISINFQDFWSRSWELLLVAVIMGIGLYTMRAFISGQSALLEIVALSMCSLALFFASVLVLKPRAYTIFSRHILPRFLSKLGR